MEKFKALKGEKVLISRFCALMYPGYKRFYAFIYCLLAIWIS